MDKFSLNNKVAIVTGCTQGLGQGMAIGLAKAGADIVGVDYISSQETKEKVENLGRNRYCTGLYGNCQYRTFKS